MAQQFREIWLESTPFRVGVALTVVGLIMIFQG